MHITKDHIGSWDFSHNEARLYNNNINNYYFNHYETGDGFISNTDINSLIWDYI